MRSLSLIAALSSVFLLGSFARVQAQTDDTEASPESAQLFGFGVGVEGESLPWAIEPGGCSYRGGGRQDAMVLGGFLVIPVGRIGLEGRVRQHWPNRHGPCGFLVTVPIDGTVTDFSTDVSSGSFATLDLRLRLAVGERGRWVFGLGAGWAAMPKDVPFLTSSVGVRGGTWLRWGADLELSSYRVSWTTRITEYEGAQIVNVLPDQRHEWASSLGLRFTLEVPVLRR